MDLTDYFGLQDSLNAYSLKKNRKPDVNLKFFIDNVMNSPDTYVAGVPDFVCNFFIYNAGTSIISSWEIMLIAVSIVWRQSLFFLH